MLENINLNHIYFLDIETVPEYAEFDSMPPEWKDLWILKSKKLDQETGADEQYPRAGIYAEFGKIICISMGRFSSKSGQTYLRIKSFYGENESKVLSDFSQLINDKLQEFSSGKLFLCAHNGKEFDFPYLARRMVINDLPIPSPLDNYGKKPWETEHLLDTMHLWRFGDYKSYTSLDLLCHALGVPTSKDDIQGSDVWKVFWQEKDLERIVKYCEKDVVAIARLFQRFTRNSPVKDEFIIRA